MLKKQLENYKENRKIQDFNTAPKLSKKMTASENMKYVNPDYPDNGTTMNCTACTTAMALREKGYDVKAINMNNGMWSEHLFQKAFNSETQRMKLNSKASSQEILQELQKNGEGSYGNLCVNWALGGGHSVFWKVENGKAKIYDGQSGEEYTKSKVSMERFTDDIVTKTITYNRLDNCTPTEYALAMVESANKK